MHLPIRLRLTLAFAASMAVLLAFAGVFLYVRLANELLATTDAALRAQADVVAAGLGEGGGNFADQAGTSVRGDETFAQILGARAQILDSSQAVATAPLVDVQDLRGLAGPVFLERAVRGVSGTARLLVVPVNEGGPERFVVVGSSLMSRQEVLSRFLVVLVVGGPIALAVASAAGWIVAGAALRPVERVRREAAEVSVSDLGRRLPVPQTGDELARLVATLNDMLSRLQISFDHERRFVDDASHELRTPLAILKAELDLALARARTPEEMEAAVRSASAEADRLVALANELLVYSRAEGGHVPVHRGDVRLDELLSEACAAFAGRARAAGVDVTVLADPRTVSVDAPRIRQAVDNVLDNAIRNTPPGGRIEIRAAVEVDVLRITIEDTGNGFPPEIAQRAFEPFARGSSERASVSDGAGLGLAIVRAIVGAHGGTAVAENRSGGGARVRLELPAEPHLRLTHL